MKLFKYIFIIIVIGLIGFSVNSIYNQNIIEEEQIDNIVSHKQIITNIKLGISKYDTMNPILSNNKSVQYIDKLIFEPLLNINSDFSISNCLAKEYSKTGDFSYLIKLRDNVKWHDGMPFVAKDVQFTIDRLKDTENVIESIYKDNVKSIKKIDVIDDNTLKITLDDKIPFFEYNLIFPILPYHYYIDDDFVQSTKIPIGTGEYKINEIGTSYVTLLKNDEWWNTEQQPQIDKININLYSSMGEVYNAFKIGNIDIIPTENDNFNQYIGTIGFQVEQFPSREYDFLAINTANNVLKHKEVRQAIAYAIDKNNIVGTIYNHNCTVSEYPLDYGHYLYDGSIEKKEFNPEYAQKLLEDNGWTLRYRSWSKIENYRTIRTSFNLVVNSSNVKRVAVAESIKNQLHEIGIEITIKKVSDEQYVHYLENRNYDLILSGTFISALPDLKIYFGKDNFTNEEVDKIMSTLSNIYDKKTLKERYKVLEKIYQEEVPYISLYRNKEYLIYNPNVIGEFHPNWFNVYYNIENWHKQK